MRDNIRITLFKCHKPTCKQPYSMLNTNTFIVPLCMCRTHHLFSHTNMKMLLYMFWWNSYFTWHKKGNIKKTQTRHDLSWVKLYDLLLTEEDETTFCVLLCGWTANMFLYTHKLQISTTFYKCENFQMLWDKHIFLSSLLSGFWSNLFWPKTKTGCPPLIKLPPYLWQINKHCCTTSTIYSSLKTQ